LDLIEKLIRKNIFDEKRYLRKSHIFTTGSKTEWRKETVMNRNTFAKISTSVLAVFLVAALATTVFAAPWQQWRGSGGWGMGGAYQRMYNPATVETISGKITAINEVTPMKGMSYGIHLTVKTDKGPVSVMLGPAWYIERLDTKLAKGDMVEVKGSRISYEGKPAIVAAEVKKGDAVLKLRDDNGVPAWAGWRR
jgi:hypothetical protein